MSSAEFEYGPDIPGETELRLLGPVAGKRLLVLGCRRTDAILSLARHDAKVIVVDHAARRVDKAREACEKAAVRVEFHPPDLADLAFLRGDSIDATLSVSALAEVEDLNRVFRQVHRVLTANAPLALSLPIRRSPPWTPTAASRPGWPGATPTLRPCPAAPRAPTPSTPTPSAASSPASPGPSSGSTPSSSPSR